MPGRKHTFLYLSVLFSVTVKFNSNSKTLQKKNLKYLFQIHFLPEAENECLIKLKAIRSLVFLFGSGEVGVGPRNDVLGS